MNERVQFNLNVLYRIERDIEDLKYAYDKANERWDEGEDE